MPVRLDMRWSLTVRQGREPMTKLHAKHCVLLVAESDPRLWEELRKTVPVRDTAGEGRH